MNGRLQRGVIIIPSALTVANLFFGIWALVSAARGHFNTAAWLIVLAGTADTLDGRVARVTRTGSRFGAELDSLVDAVSFGVAPAFVMYHIFLADGQWSWIASFMYVTGAVVRLARFNVEQSGHAKVAFHGLPSPAAGMSLATFYPFSQTGFFQQHLAGLPWPVLMTAFMVILGVLMMSHVLYPVVPKFGFRSARGIGTLVLFLAVLAAVFTIPALFFFPALLAYVAYGIGKALVLGFFERLPERDLLLDSESEEGDEADAELRELDYDEFAPHRRIWWPHRRRPRREHEGAPEAFPADRQPDSGGDTDPSNGADLPPTPGKKRPPPEEESE
ncbi:MAG: CDP-diacylglycerol--serine O-phosphatidyltransferase [Gemmatimonadetes bacterium]|nr:CDP-diacylglycerol--serine O-phosphatidyltransferase [Gemmatimonadota bacterium]